MAADQARRSWAIAIRIDGRSGRASDAVAAAESENTPKAVIVEDFQPTEIFDTNRPCLTTVEKDRLD